MNTSVMSDNLDAKSAFISEIAGGHFLILGALTRHSIVKAIFIKWVSQSDKNIAADTGRSEE